MNRDTLPILLDELLVEKHHDKEKDKSICVLKLYNTKEYFFFAVSVSIPKEAQTRLTKLTIQLYFLFRGYFWPEDNKHFTSSADDANIMDYVHPVMS